MQIICKLLPLVLLASALSLSSCVNQVKDAPKTQVQDTTKGKDTLSRLAIVFNIPDSNSILTVDFHAAMTPSWQKNYRIDWNFGDSTGIISKFDTSNLTHYFQKFGAYLVTLSVIDTISKTVLGKTSVLLDIEDNAIDTNYLHGFTKLSMSFSGVKQYDTGQAIVDFNMTGFQKGNGSFSNIQWNGTIFTYNGRSSWQDVHKPDPNNPNTWYYYNGDEVISIQGSISRSGYIVDSGLFNFDHSERNSSYHYFDCEEHGNLMQFQSLPYTIKDSSNLTYSFSGPHLNNIITSYLEYNFSQSQLSYFICNPIKNYNDISSKILWDQQPSPTLTLTFSK